MNRLWLLLRLALTAVTLAGTSHAHDPFEVTAVARISSNELVVEATLARSGALALIAPEPARRATFAREPFSACQARLQELAPSFYRVGSDGRTLAPRNSRAILTPENEVELSMVYDRPQGALLSFEASHLGRLGEGYTSALSVSGNAVAFKVLTAADPYLELHLGSDQPAASSPRDADTGFWRFVVLGVEHILTGYDHLLFLAGVLMVCRTLRAMLALVTSFTIAHSVTLALAVLGRVTIPSQLVEPLIMASIVWVGVENLLLKGEPARRLLVTFAFGLVHGLGFATMLEGLTLGTASLPVALVSFNLGVELGQLAVSALALPLLLRLHTMSRGMHGLRLASSVVAGVGLFWFVERLVTS